ncbi:ComC/BlpC family leader-containing pheromone/bacteriocin [Streptococcus sp. 27098_8_69]
MKKNTDFAQMKDFQELNEKELQKIRGGEWRPMYTINNFLFSKSK